MKTLAILVGAVAVAVFATAAVSGNAGITRAAHGDQASAVSLQKQVNELRSELICLEAVSGDGYAQDWWVASSASGPKPQTPLDDRGVCAKLGIKQMPDTGSSAVLPQPYAQLIARAFGR
ncbi:MAG TPA: hypothetical protein VGH92_11915 [Gaiellaceae bacterium]